MKFLLFSDLSIKLSKFSPDPKPISKVRLFFFLLVSET